jgi:uncharacterized protein
MSAIDRFSIVSIVEVVITPRDLDVDFATVPRHWLANNAAATAVSNGVNLLFPHGERFFVRSVKYFLDRIDDPTLRAQIKGFFGQEGRHARAHDDFNDILRHQGYEVDRFLELYERITTWVEKRLSPEMRLAITAASEHFTATLAEGAFKHDVFDGCHPHMRDLLAWHAAEEIEHKSVAYDVLQRVDPSYRLRVLGLVWATIMLGGFWIAAATMLLRQDGLNWFRGIRKMSELPKRDPVVRRVFLRGIRTYLRRDFHPSKTGNDHLAAEWFASRGLTLPQAA